MLLLLGFNLILLSFSIHQSECAQLTKSTDFSQRAKVNISLNEYLFDYLNIVSFNIGKVEFYMYDWIIERQCTISVDHITLHEFEKYTNEWLNSENTPNNLRITCNFQIKCPNENFIGKIIGDINLRLTPVENTSESNFKITQKFYIGNPCKNCKDILDRLQSTLGQRINQVITAAFSDTKTEEGVLQHMRDRYKPVFILPYSEEEPGNRVSISHITIGNLATFTVVMNDVVDSYTKIEKYFHSYVVSLKEPLQLFVKITTTEGIENYIDFLSGTIKDLQFHVIVTVEDDHSPKVEIIDETAKRDRTSYPIDIDKIFDGKSEYINSETIDHVKRVTMASIRAALKAAFTRAFTELRDEGNKYSLLGWAFLTLRRSIGFE